MSTRDLAWAVIALVALGCARATVVETPNLGRPATADQIAGWDISVGPDGVGPTAQAIGAPTCPVAPELLKEAE